MPVDDGAFTFATSPERAIATSTVNPACFQNQDLKESGHSTHSPGAGGAVGTIFVIPSHYPDRTLHSVSTDINDIKLLNSEIEDSDDDSGSDSSSDEVRPRLAAKDVKRHYWHKGNIKYWFAYQGRKHYVTAEEMVTRFPGTKAAL
ncbi:hypothetical protein QFC20_007692 [Naganishia adeliensis]|uniref:Uncharacterized protein n=1 Tax=Naganishia adeliensis TaxID=92952 RepID=A0ACC2UVY5_9TREE|nr:hypothetical protein QFC20_007692 [Naganishia adeliensis]